MSLFKPKNVKQALAKLDWALSKAQDLCGDIIPDAATQQAEGKDYAASHIADEAWKTLEALRRKIADEALRRHRKGER